MQWGPDLVFYPNMYIVLVGPSGARKSTAMKSAGPMLEELGIKLSSDSISSEALIRELAETTDNVILEDGYTEAHCSLTVYSEELTVFLGYDNLKMMANLCDWYDCKRHWKYTTKWSGKDDINGVWVNLLGATTPALLQSTLPRDAIGGGLTARMILIYEEAKGKVVSYPGMDPEVMKLREQLVRDLEQISMMRGNFKVTRDFLAVWDEWYKTQDKNPPFQDDRFDGYLNRRPVHILKLCMIISASRSTSLVIEQQDFARAVSMLSRAEVKMRYAFTGIGKSRDSDTMVKVMTYMSVMREATLSELMIRFWQDADQRTMQAILVTLKTAGCLSFSWEGNGIMRVRFIKSLLDGGQS